MPMPPFERVHKATNLGLSHFAKCLPLLLRAALLLLFAWYSLELFLTATADTAKIVLAIIAISVFMTLSLVMLFTYRKYPWMNDAGAPSRTTRLWPFLLINLLMIVLAAAIGKWEQHRGSPGFTNGLLGFTQVWIHKLGDRLTGR